MYKRTKIVKHPVTKVISSLLPLLQATRNIFSCIRQPSGCLHLPVLISSSMGLIIKGAFYVCLYRGWVSSTSNQESLFSGDLAMILKAHNWYC